MRDPRVSKEERLHAEPTLSEFEAVAHELAMRKAPGIVHLRVSDERAKYDADQIMLDDAQAMRDPENGIPESKQRRRSARGGPNGKLPKPPDRPKPRKQDDETPVSPKTENPIPRQASQDTRRVSTSATSSSGSFADRKKRKAPLRPQPLDLGHALRCAYRIRKFFQS